MITLDSTLDMPLPWDCFTISLTAADGCDYPGAYYVWRDWQGDLSVSPVCFDGDTVGALIRSDNDTYEEDVVNGVVCLLDGPVFMGIRYETEFPTVRDLVNLINQGAC